MGIGELYRAIQSVPDIGKGEKSGVSPKEAPKTKPSEFDEILNNQVQLSKHADTRIRSRNIPWNPEIQERVTKGIDQAQAKGSREVLVLADDVAVIANAKTKTVITAMDRTQLKEQIFTNIDSAVIV